MFMANVRRPAEPDRRTPADAPRSRARAARGRRGRAARQGRRGGTSCTPALLVTYPDSALTEVSEPVLARTLFAAAVFTIRVRSVPPAIRSGLPAIGNAPYQVANHGRLRTDRSSAVICVGVTRSCRDSPAPST